MSEEKGTLRRATVDLITNEECKKKLEGRFKVQSVHLCAFTPGVDACQGDSGGPASLASADGRHTQVGIVSLGAGCGDYRFPALYTRVTKVHRHNMCIKYKLSKDENKMNFEKVMDWI